MEDRRLIKYVLLIITLTISQIAMAEEIKPFTSDGCSSFPEGTSEQNNLWLACCTVHDYAYWKGGTYQDRINADLELHQCVKQVGEESIALIMLAGVRVGGSPFFPTDFRWGYGWPYPRLYGVLTKKEQDAVKEAELKTDKFKD